MKKLIILLILGLTFSCKSAIEQTGCYEFHQTTIQSCTSVGDGKTFVDSLIYKVCDLTIFDAENACAALNTEGRINDCIYRTTCWIRKVN